MSRSPQRTTKLQTDHAYRLSCAVLQDLVDARACAMRIDGAAVFASDTAALDLPGLQLLEHLAECWHKLRIPEVARERLGIPAAEEIVTVLRDDLAARNVSPTYAATHLTDELIARSYTTPTSDWLTAAGAAWDAAPVDEARDDAS